MKPRGYLYFLPAGLYMALIAGLAGRPAPLFAHCWPIWLGIKPLHLVEYGLLAALLLWGFCRGTQLRRRAVYLAVVVLTALWGVGDELRQAGNPARTARRDDALTDTLAAALCIGADALRRGLQTRSASDPG